MASGARRPTFNGTPRDPTDVTFNDLYCKLDVVLTGVQNGVVKSTALTSNPVVAISNVPKSSTPSWLALAP